MSSRVTRSSAKKSADSSSSASVDLSSINHNNQPASLPPPPTPPATRKRKASQPSSTVDAPDTVPQASTPRAKRVKSKPDPSTDVEAVLPNKKTRSRKQSAAVAAMPSSPDEEGPPPPPGPSNSSKRKSGKSKKTSSPTETSPATSKAKSKPSSSSKKRTSTSKKEKEEHSDEPTSPDQANHSNTSTSPNTSTERPSDSVPPPRQSNPDALDSALGGTPFSRGGAFGDLGAFGGIASYYAGVTNRMRDLLVTLKNREDPIAQHEALQEISEMLLISTEDNLSHSFNADAYAKEFVRIASMTPTDADFPLQLMELDPQLPSRMRLLATRCIANLIEALPSATAPVVYNNAVPALISKLRLSDEFDLELAEQALTTLEKISAEFPSAIIREGGLNALLQNLDFFLSSVQRTAVTAAANCCKNIPEESFDTVKEVMPTLRNVLNSSDQKVVEQGSQCITRIVDSFKFEDEKLEELMNPDMLGAILRLLLPGSTNLISPNIHTQFLKVLSTTAKASPSLTKELFKMDITDTLYQILTGVSAPPQDDENVASSIDSVVVMQALIHRPRDQIFETLKVICELLPGMDTANLGFLNEIAELTRKSIPQAQLPKSGKKPIDKRLKALAECKTEMRRFATVLFPTLTDAFSSTVNLHVRQLVLTAQLKMLCNLDRDILEDALRPVPYASYLASILSQQDHPFLVMIALQAAELLFKRLGSVYSYQFYREGVISEVRKLANRSLVETQAPTEIKKDTERGDSNPSNIIIPEAAVTEEAEPVAAENMSTSDASDHEAEDEDDAENNDEDIAEEVDVDVDMADDDDASSEDSDSHEPPPPPIQTTDNVQDIITRCAGKFISQFENYHGSELRARATQVLDDLHSLVQNIADCFTGDQPEEGAKLFSELAKSFEGNALENITSSELLSSKVVHTLVDLFDVKRGQANLDARAAFVEAFMSTQAASNVKTGSSASPSTPFSVLVQKLQDLLSRAEHFEVVTINSASHDNNRGNPLSALSKQIRVRLVAEGDESGVAPPMRQIMVSIHAIATLKSLEEYLRPRIANPNRPRAPRDPATPGELGRMSSTLAEAARNAGLPIPESMLSRRLASSPNPLTAPPQPPQTTTRSSSARRPPKTPKSPVEPESAPGPSSASVPQTRRSSRKVRTPAAAQPSTPPPPPDTPPIATADSQNTLECADEAPLSEEDENEALDEGSTLMATMGQALAGSPPEPEPSAVNVDVTPSGAITTREENESVTPSAAARASLAGLSGLSGLSEETKQMLASGAFPPSFQRYLQSQSIASNGGRRSLSYAKAVASTPTDWHLEFSANGTPIPSDMTVYKTVHSLLKTPEDTTSRNLWMQTHTIQFKKVKGPPPESQNLSSRPITPPDDSSSLPESLQQNPVTAVILRLLRILHEINATIDELLGEKRKSSNVSPEPLSQFVNTKLTAKMNRQLEEPLIVASRSLPSWSEDLARIYPFLFPFETRHLFLQSTSFGYGRSIQRWLNAQESEPRSRRRDERLMLHRVPRQKVRIQRQRFLESAVKVMESYGSNSSILEVEYFEEVGTGLGPTLEFYSTASKEFSQKKLKLWRENESSSSSDFAFAKHGLFPAPMNEEQISSHHGEKVLKFFSALGKFVARSMLDSRIIDISFNPMFFRWGAGTKTMPHTITALRLVDEDLAKSLATLKQFELSRKRIMKQKGLSQGQKQVKIAGIRVADASIEDMGLSFTLPGYPDIELSEDGKNNDVGINNVGQYVDAVINFTLGTGVKQQIESFRKGFSEVFPYDALRAFTPDELVMLFGRVDEDWSMETLTDSIKADHGYNMDSKSVRNLLQAMTESTAQERRNFLQFVTGSPKLPIGGFKSLTPMLTVVLRPSESGHHADEYLPSCMTCVNYLKLPDYSDLDVMKIKLGVATQEGQGAFHLS